MTDLKRWSSSDSDVDPVLRSVLRYARDVAPDGAHTQTLLQRLDGGENASVWLRRTARSSGPSVMRRLSLAAAVVLGMGGIAWAGYATFHVGNSAPRAAVALTDLPRQPRLKEANAQEAESLNAGASSVGLAPSQPQTVASSLNPPHLTRSAAKDVSKAVTKADEADTADDAELLRMARAAMRSQPNRALALTQTHTKRFPLSELAEERAALQVEALRRLGQIAEFTRAREAFELRFPSSPYRRRLRAPAE